MNRLVLLSRSLPFRRFVSSEATAATVNFCLPHETLYQNAPFESLLLPGVEGEYGVTAGHVPYVAQLQAGVVQVVTSGDNSEKYFVPGGYAMTHANSTTVRCPNNVGVFVYFYFDGVSHTN